MYVKGLALKKEKSHFKGERRHPEESQMRRNGQDMQEVKMDLRNLERAHFYNPFQRSGSCDSLCFGLVVYTRLHAGRTLHLWSRLSDP